MAFGFGANAPAGGASAPTAPSFPFGAAAGALAAPAAAGGGVNPSFGFGRPAVPATTSTGAPAGSNDECPPECAGVCFWKPVSELSDVASLLQFCHSYCESDIFTKLLLGLGFGNPAFQRNGVGTALCEKLQEELAKLDATSKIALVFHGTASGNIPDILQRGLDPNKRSGQAHGPGEYFSKEPGISVSYCKGGLQMLIFAVVLPTPQANCPTDYVVVNNNQHQLPVGTLSFSSVDPNVMQTSQDKKLQFRQLGLQVYEKQRLADETARKAKIIQHIINYEVDIGSELYTKHVDELSDTSKKEIAMYAHRALDEEIVHTYFPGLPEPMKGHERDEASIAPVDVAERDAVTAHQQLSEASSKMQGLSFS